MNLDRDDVARIIAQVRGDVPGAEFVDRVSNERTRWRVYHGGEQIEVVYDKRRHSIRQARPPRPRG